MQGRQQRNGNIDQQLTETGLYLLEHLSSIVMEWGRAECEWGRDECEWSRAECEWGRVEC